MDYFKTFVTPYYKSKGIDLTAPDALENASDLRNYAAGLQANHDVRLILNRNDFLLAGHRPGLAASHPCAIANNTLEEGGHLGNLSHPLCKQPFWEHWTVWEQFTEVKIAKAASVQAWFCVSQARSRLERNICSDFISASSSDLRKWLAAAGA